MDAGEKLLHFPAGARWFAVPVAGISEIREAGPVTPVPGAPPAIAGIIEMRGRIVTLMDLAEIFGLGHRSFRAAASRCSSRTRTRTSRCSSPPRSRTFAPTPGPPRRPRRTARRLPRPGPARRPLGREVLLAGGAPAFLLDLQALTDHCTARVRDRFRVTA